MALSGTKRPARTAPSYRQIGGLLGSWLLSARSDSVDRPISGIAASTTVATVKSTLDSGQEMCPIKGHSATPSAATPSHTSRAVLGAL